MLKKAKNILAFLCLLAIVFSVGYAYLWLDWNPVFSYQEGYLQKLSKKGFICKTWEGELVVEPDLGIKRKFQFSIRDDDVARKVQEHLGSPVHLEYQIHHGITFFGCLGDTLNFATGVTRKSENKQE